VHEVSRRVWGLRLRRTEPELALACRFMLPSAHYKDVGVRVASFRSSIARPAYSPVYASPCTSRYPTQNSGPSGSLLLTRENFHSLRHAGLARRTEIAILGQLSEVLCNIDRFLQRIAASSTTLKAKKHSQEGTGGPLPDLWRAVLPRSANSARVRRSVKPQLGW